MKPLTTPSVDVSTGLPFALTRHISSHGGVDISTCFQKPSEIGTILFRPALFAFSFLLCLAGPFGTGISRATTIDDFSQGDLFLLATSPYRHQSVVQEGLGTSAVIGGVRSVYAGTLEVGSLSIDSAVGRFLFSADSSWGYFSLEYGSTTPLSADLCADGSDRFVINIDELTPGLWRGIFEFEVSSDDTWCVYNFGEDIVDLNGPGQLTIPFSCFPGVDFTDVQTIKIDVGRFEPTYRIGITSIMTVPEPGMLTMLLGLGVGLTLLVYKDRKRDKGGQKGVRKGGLFSDPH